jgi:hypothetical protein
MTWHFFSSSLEAVHFYLLNNENVEPHLKLSKVLFPAQQHAQPRTIVSVKHYLDVVFSLVFRMVEAEEEYVEQLEILISCFLRPFKVSIVSIHRRHRTDFPQNFKCFEEK